MLGRIQRKVNGVRGIAIQRGKLLHMRGNNGGPERHYSH
jgi:hypothetical protein